MAWILEVDLAARFMQALGVPGVMLQRGTETREQVEGRM